MLNHIVLMGRLTRDPELRYTQSQIPVASFRLAVDRDFGGRDGGERQIGADELLVINSGTIHAVTAYPNQAIVLQVPYEMLLQYMEHYDQLYFVVDERPASEAEKQKLAEFKAVLREMDEVYGAQKEGYQLKFDSLLLEALYRLLVDYAVRIGKEFRRIRKPYIRSARSCGILRSITLKS